MAASIIGDNDDSDLYHYDFTTASDWEIFIARIEEIIHQWKIGTKKKQRQLTRNEYFNAKWERTSENIKFADVDFTFTRYTIHTDNAESKLDKFKNDSDLEESINVETLNDLQKIEHDFVPVVFAAEDSYPHVLARWYGLRDFIVLETIRGNISSESKIKILLSSFCIAANNSNCEIPLFVRVMENWQRFYIGICEAQGVRTEFEMIHLKKVPQQCKHLSGLLSLFKSKIPFTTNPVVVSSRFSYVLQDWTSFSWSQQPPDFEMFNGEIGLSDIGKLPFGVSCEPINSITLYATWPELLESVVVDTESYTDLDPTRAPHWSLSISKTDNLVCLLSDYLNDFLQLCSSNKQLDELISDLISRHSNDNFMQPLSLLTESKIPTLSSILQRSSARKSSCVGPVPETLLVPIIYYLFPDSCDSPANPYPEDQNLEHAQRMKTCNEDSIVWRLSIVMAHAVHSFGGIRAAAHIWYEFCQEIRFRWTNGMYIPGVAPGFPDTKTCLLHQKLQMVNCCVSRRLSLERESLQCEDSEESDDEFYDCEDGAGDEIAPKQSIWNNPVGRLSQHESLRLIQTGQPLYIPKTQGDIPKTEDQLEEDTEKLLQLGSDSEGSQMRAKLMSASLLSDMESFKAANPGAVLEDFIRLYSPRDWIESEELNEYNQKKGELSARMKLQGNTWMEVWECAKPVPARRQKRLFDDAKEGELALRWAETADIGSAAKFLLPTLVHAALVTTRTNAKQYLDHMEDLQTTLSHIERKVEALTRLPNIDLRRYQELEMELNHVEITVAYLNSLKSKLCPEGSEDDSAISEFIISLVSHFEVDVPEGPKGIVAARLKTMFSEAYKAAQMLCEPQESSNSSQSKQLFPESLPNLPVEPQEKEFIMRAIEPVPTQQSRPLPQRLTVRVSKSGIAMAGAFSQDTIFF